MRILLAVSVSLLSATFGCKQAPTLPVLATVPAFEFTQSDAGTFRSEELRGKVWVANFIFTRCQAICPRFTSRMSEVEGLTKDLGDKVAFVSFTVDPDFDTPAVLAEYAREHRATSPRWHFVTGTREALSATVVEGMKLTMEKEAPKDLMTYAHAGYFALLDGQMRVRGYYGLSNGDVVEALVRDVKVALSER